MALLSILPKSVYKKCTERETNLQTNETKIFTVRNFTDFDERFAVTMVLASVKLSMPGGDSAKKRKRRCDAPSIPGDAGSQDPSSAPRTKRRRASGATRSTTAAAARTVTTDSGTVTLEEEFRQLSRGGGVVHPRGRDPTPRPSPLRIKLSVKRVANQTTAAAAAAGPDFRNKTKVDQLHGTGHRSAFGAPVPSLQPWCASEDAPPPRDYRSLIEEHRNKEMSSSARGGEGEGGSGLWVCRHCGARRKEGKRGAALSNLLSHLRSCVKSDVVEEYLNNHGKSAGTKKPPAKKSSLVAAKREAKPTTTTLDGSCASVLPPRIQPAKSDVCLGDGSNRGYRLLKDAVKGVRMSVDEESWEYMAVSQTLEGLRRVHRHPNRRFLVRSPGNGWVEASDTVVRKKIIALYRRYFRFKSGKVAADPLPGPMNCGTGAPFGLGADPFAVFEETEPRRPGTDLDAGIIRHVLIEEDVSLPVPGHETGPRGSALHGPFEVSISESSAASIGDGAHSSSFQKVTATGDDEPGEVERSWETSVYREVRSQIAAKWYTLEQEREQRAVLLQQQMVELRAAQSTYAERKALVESAHARYSELAANAGVAVDRWTSSSAAVDDIADLRATDTRTYGEAEDALAGRIKKRVGALKAATVELDGELGLWKDRTGELENLISALDRPTEDYLRANARLAELEAQAEDLLKHELV
jgi:hypothetical protein